MTRFLSIRGILILVTASLLGLLLWGLLHREDLTPTTKEDKKISTYPVLIENLSLSTYDHDRLLTRVKADKLKINPRRFQLFHIKFINEVTIINAELEIYLYNDKETPLDNDKETPLKESLSSLVEGILSHKKGKVTLKEIGYITRGVIKDLSIKVYKAGMLSISAKASEAQIDFKKKVAKMTDARIEDILSGKVINSKSIIWDSKEEVFKIPGEYTAMSPKGTAKGRGLKLDLNFKAEKLGK